QSVMGTKPRGSGQGKFAYVAILGQRCTSSARDRWACERLVSAVHNFSYFVEMRIDLIGQIIKLAPGLAKIRRLVSLLQEFAGFPLDVIDDAPAVEASVQAD